MVMAMSMLMHMADVFWASFARQRGSGEETSLSLCTNECTHALVVSRRSFSQCILLPFSKLLGARTWPAWMLPRTSAPYAIENHVRVDQAAIE